MLVEPRNPSIFPIDSVVSDDFYGGKLAVKHLLALGHRSIACIGTSEAYVTQLRFDGYRIALNDAEIAYQPELFVQVRSDLTVDEGRWAMQQLLERGVKFSAVFCMQCSLAEQILSVGTLLSLFHLIRAGWLFYLRLTQCR
ncbi:MAG: substrate-binding domain-containing protein [Ktedonobacteraceae bacterium]|nr:substrate-binding domain-containing protein [Ktedonobacteraceae bacterium]